MNVKLKVLTAGVLFFMGGEAVMAQKSKKDSVETKSIDEVVVVGYQKKKISEITGSIQKIGGEKINTPTAQTFEAALQGVASGVQVSATSGTPGAVQDIRIRGVGSINASSRPLFVIDGVPVIEGNQSQSTAQSSFSLMSTVNNNDIESVTVLKDASSIAQYGSRGANGVILITTKKGKKGKSRFSFDTNIGFQNDAYYKRNALTGAQRLQLLQEQLVNQGRATDANSALTFISNNNLGNYKVWNNAGRPEYNWSDQLKNKDAFFQTYNISVQGGGEHSTNYASLGYNETEATVIGPAFKRTTGLFKYTNDLTEKIKLQTSISGSFTQQNPILDQSSYFANPFIAKIMMTPWANPYLADGSPNSDLAAFTSIFNPLYLTAHNETRTRVIRGINNNRLDWKLLKNLNLFEVVNIDYILTDFKDYRNRVHGDGAAKKGTSARSTAQEFTWVNQTGLNYDFKIADVHNFTATAIYEYQKYTNDYVYAYGDTFATDDITNVATAAANYQASSTYSDWKNIAFLGLLDYNYNNKLSFSGSIRREGSSRFASNNRFGTFWSVGGAYNISKDINSSNINELKVHASYGTSGNSNLGINKYQELIGYDANYAGLGAGYPTNFGNPNLTWEKQKMLDIGVDFALFNSRISGSATYFNKDTYDLLLDVPLSRTTGFDTQSLNIGTVNNRGFEFQLSGSVIKTEDFEWSLNAQFSPIRNKVTDLANDINGNIIDPLAGSSYKTTRIGESIGSWYLRTWAGVDPATGAPLWYVNGVDGATTSDYNSAARVIQGSAIPKFTGGFGTNIRFKNWFVNALFSFAGGHKIYEQYAQFYLRTNNFATVSYNGDQELLDRWQKPGDITNVPKLNYSTNDFFHSSSSRHLYDGDFIRLRDIGIGYSLPQKYLETIGLTGFTISLRGTNLLTWVKDKNLKLDPEVPADGYTRLTTPPVKAITVGFNIKF